MPHRIGSYKFVNLLWKKSSNYFMDLMKWHGIMTCIVAGHHRIFCLKFTLNIIYATIWQFIIIAKAYMFNFLQMLDLPVTFHLSIWFCIKNSPNFLIPMFLLNKKIIVEAITDIKKLYNVTSRNWQGDPCVPSEYSWDGLNCSGDNHPRIISL